MDARLRNLFSRRRSQKRDQLRLKAHPYESTVKEKSPIKGTRPIAGNGPYRLENIALQAQELAAEPPNVPRARRDSYSSRPQTAPTSNFQPAQFESYGRTRSGFSTKTPSTSYRQAHELSRRSPYYPAPTTQRVRSVSAFSTDSHRSHKQSAHVDILDAVTRINPSAQALIQKRIASGKRDYYGEDVADRNIAEFGGDQFPQHDAYSYTDDEAAHTEDDPSQVNEWQARPDSRGKLDSRDGSTRGPVSRLESDGAGDDTTVLNQPTEYSASRIYSHANQNPSNSTSPTATNSHTRRESANSDYNANSIRGKARPGRSSSASTNARRSVIPDPSSNAIASANLYCMNGGFNHAASTNESLREEANSSQPIRRTKESRGTQTTPPPPDPVIPPPAAAATSSSQQDTNDLDSDAYDPPPISRSRLSRRIILPTPPMSPTTGGSPTTSIPRASLDNEPPPPPPVTQASSAPKRHSRGGSASYSVFPPQESGRSVKAAGPAKITPSENGGTAIRPNDNKRGVRVFEDLSEPPRLEDVVDTSNTTDTEVIKTQLPAVVHEHVTPTVQHQEERITREIHNDDVFHRIQPIVDVEGLPTKHYIPAPNSNGLIEIPESQLPSRHTNWAVQPVENNRKTSASVPSGSNIKTAAQYPNDSSSRDPLIQDGQKTVTDGVPREETVWRHPSQLENGARETGQTVPLNIDHYEKDITDDNDTSSERYAASDLYANSEQTISTNAGGEEELLFRDSDLAFDGRLPGLEDMNPAVEGTLPASRPATADVPARKVDDIGEREATKALRRRASELVSKEGRLSVAKKSG